MKEIKKIQKIILEFTDITRDILFQFKNKNLPRIHPLTVQLLFLKRFHYNSLAINNLLDKYEQDRSFKIPLYMILRVCISDFLTLKYFDKIIRDNQHSQKTIEDNIKSFLVDNLHYLIKELNILKDSGKFNNKEYNSKMNNIQKNYPEFFDVSAGKLINSNAKSISAIAKILKSDIYCNEDSNVYDLFNQFSKFEHIGALTFDITSDDDIYLISERNSIIWTVSHIIFGLDNLIVNLPENENFIDRFKKLSDSLTELINL